MSGLSIGIDVGGTFTDLVAIDVDGTAYSRKVLSTPEDQSEGVATALSSLAAEAARIGRVVHGTTVATNALLERTGARTVLCATEGATDLLELRWQERASLYDLARHHPPPLVSPDLCLAVAERIAPEGVLRPLTTGVARALAARAKALEPETIAVSLLHSYLDSTHERLLGQALQQEMDRVPIVLSSEVLPQIREYERTATTAAEAYLRPRVAQYLHHLEKGLSDKGFPIPAVMTSSGGMRSATDAARAASSLALSGPAAGVVGAAYVARLAGFANSLTIDIGGTSADAGVILDGSPLIDWGGAVAGVPIALPRVLVETVSAGGGSIGWVDDGGALRVGPRSAGARPGPAAFGRGGTEATVTDAQIVLGNVRSERLSGGVALDSQAARNAVTRLATRVGQGATIERTSSAMIAAANAAMARALRHVSVERGVDPRTCLLVAFGGGGPLHACALAAQLGMRTVLVPPFAGVLSALGLAIAAEQRESLMSVMKPAALMEATQVDSISRALAARAGGGKESSRGSWIRARYIGQGHELEVAILPGDDGARIATRFEAAHDSRYGFTLGQPVELVSARHVASGAAHKITLERRGAASWDGRVDNGGRLEASVRGPGVVTLADSTLMVEDGWSARALQMGGWLLEQDA